jgi:hypothetical protein
MLYWGAMPLKRSEYGAIASDLEKLVGATDVTEKTSDGSEYALEFKLNESGPYELSAENGSWIFTTPRGRSFPVQLHEDGLQYSVSGHRYVLRTTNQYFKERPMKHNGTFVKDDDGKILMERYAYTIKQSLENGNDYNFETNNLISYGASDDEEHPGLWGSGLPGRKC